MFLKKTYFVASLTLFDLFSVFGCSDLGGLVGWTAGVGNCTVLGLVATWKAGRHVEQCVGKYVVVV
jgi:hypothetical protein